MKFTKSFVGTPYCMSPEILRNVFYDHKVDIWALGIILYQMTHNGRVPFQCKTIDQLREKINNSKFIIDECVYGSFRVIIQKCLQISPHKRIKLESLIKHIEIRKYLKGHCKNYKKINQIDKIPTYENEWMNIVKNIPNNLPQQQKTQVEKRSIKNNVEFMKNYSKDNLVHLNTRLIDVIVEKNIIISKLEKELTELRQLKLII